VSRFAGTEGTVGCAFKAAEIVVADPAGRIVFKDPYVKASKNKTADGLSVKTAENPPEPGQSPSRPWHHPLFGISALLGRTHGADNVSP